MQVCTALHLPFSFSPLSFSSFRITSTNTFGSDVLGKKKAIFSEYPLAARYTSLKLYGYIASKSNTPPFASPSCLYPGPPQGGLTNTASGDGCTFPGPNDSDREK